MMIIGLQPISFVIILVVWKNRFAELSFSSSSVYRYTKTAGE